MEFCSRCIQPNTRPGISFTDGLCGACRNINAHQQEKDWTAIRAELDAIVDEAKATARERGGYDAVVGVSGGKDSTFQALYAKEELGLNVLLVNCVPEGITDAGRHNIENLIQQGFDCVHLRPNPKVTYAVVKRGLLRARQPGQAHRVSPLRGGVPGGPGLPRAPDRAGRESGHHPGGGQGYRRRG